MKILRTYFLSEFIGTLLLWLGIMTFIMLLGNLIPIANMVITKGVDLGSVALIFLYLIPTFFTYTLPIATLVAILLSVGRLASDNEIMAIRSCGIHLFSLIAPLITVGLIFSLCLVVINDRVVPYTHFATRKTVMEVGLRNPAAALEPGVFITSFQKYVLFIYRIEGNKLMNVRIYEPQEGKPARTIVAKSGEFISDLEKRTVKLKLVDGSSDEPDADNPLNFYKLNFKTYFMTLNLNDMANKDELNKKPSDMTLAELLHEGTVLKSTGIDALPLITEFHQRLALAFSCSAFVILGCALALATRRREKSLNFGLAFMIAAVYYLILIAGETFAQQGIVDPRLALWLPNILFSLIGIGIISRICEY